MKTGFFFFILIILASVGSCKSKDNICSYMLIKVDGDNQIGKVAKTLNKSLKIIVLDEQENLQQNVPLNISVLQGNGIVNNEELITDSDGKVEIIWTLGGIGEQKLAVDIKNRKGEIMECSRIIFSATAVFDSCENYHPHLGNFLDFRDSTIYKTVQIGTQTWFAENLRYNTGDFIRSDSTICETYGNLYKWNTAISACPNGWHLPSNYEWNLLEIYLGMNPADSSNETNTRGPHGISMKSMLRWPNGSNSSGFNVLPAGWFNCSIGQFYGLNTEAAYWSATPFNSTRAWGRKFDSNWIETVFCYHFEKCDYYSCRCVRD